MPQWIPLRKAPQLAPTQLTSPGDFPFQKDASEHDLSLSLCKAAFNSRSWVIFIAIVAFIYAGLSIVVGIILLMLGANQHLPPLVAGGLFGLVYGIDALIGGSLLASYASRLNGLRYGNKDIVLEKAMDSLRTFWIFVSINLILLLGVIVFFAIWLIAVAGSVPLSW
jgi:zinc transporter ZupT